MVAKLGCFLAMKMAVVGGACLVREVVSTIVKWVQEVSILFHFRRKCPEISALLSNLTREDLIVNMISVGGLLGKALELL